jgi:Flp pilus assembly protein TadD
MHPMRGNILLLLSLLAVLVIASFSPILKNGFVNWDDNVYLTQNPRAKNFTPEKIPQIFTSFERVQYKPLSFLVFSLENRCFRLDPRGYHSVSLLLHFINACLVFWLFFLLRRDVFLAWFVAVLFAVHPLRVESVAWVTEQKDLLYGLFFLAAAVTYVLYRLGRFPGFYYASLALFALSLMAKPMMIAFPLLLFFFDAALDRKPLASWADKIPFFVISFLMALLNYAALTWFHAQYSVSYSPLEWLQKICIYIFMVIWPARLSCFYPYAQGFLFTIWPCLVSVLFLGFFFLALRRDKGRGIFIFSIAFFVLSLAPVLAARASYAVSDRYVYIAALGIFYLAAAYARRLWLLKAAAHPALKAVFLAAGVGLVCLFSVLTFQRARIWHDSISLWKDALVKYPHVSAAHLNIAYAYAEKGDDVLARRHALEALRLEPGAWDALLLLGNIHYERREMDRAEESYRLVLRINPGAFQAYNNLGLVQLSRGRENFADAVVLFRKALQVNPDSDEAYFNLGKAYLGLGRTEDAIRCFKKAAVFNPDSALAFSALLDVFISERRFHEALGVLQPLLTLESDDQGVLLKGGVVLASLDYFDEARLLFERVLVLDPGSVDALKNLGALYGNHGDPAKAEAYFQKALDIESR